MCIRYYRRMLAALLLPPLLAGCVLAQAQERNQDQKGNYSETLDQMKIPRHRLEQETKPADLSDWPRDGAVYGPPPERLKGERAGLPLSKVPGAKRISSYDVQQMDVDKQRTGLFLVDIDFVPSELLAAMRERGITLSSNGALLDKNKEPLVVFVTSEVYKMRVQQGKEEQAHGSTNNFLENAGHVSATPAAFGNPFRFACFSFTPWAVYHGGFHRWYEADTWASAYGPDGGGGCSAASPHTRIDYIQTRAAVGGGGSYQHCFFCEQEHSHDEWDVGFFWPAHGIPTTTHSAVWADGRFSMSRTAHLTW